MHTRENDKPVLMFCALLPMNDNDIFGTITETVGNDLYGLQVAEMISKHTQIFGKER